MEKSLLLIGGCNVDFIATSDNKLIRHVSNIGKVSTSFGGVMRNICENLARLGNKIDFITAVGNDTYGNAIRENLEELGVNFIAPKTDLPTGTYVAINDCNRDLSEAICDGRVHAEVSAEFLKEHDGLIKEHEYIIIDANLDKNTIDYIFKNYSDKKIIVEAISPTKVEKFKEYLDKIFLIKCNIHEARKLMGIDLLEKDLVGGLLARGVKNVVVSHGKNDIYFGCDYRKVDLVQVVEVTEYVNTTGSGDALTSGVIDHYLRGYSLKESVAFGNELARLTLMSHGATSKEIEKYKHD